jgi:putative two-component system protein, hydrogenase maturation factor HypX/HoxX
LRILFLTRSFNGLAQRLFLALQERGHEVAVEFDISDSVTLEAAALWQPALVIAPYLQRAIPEAVWRQFVCLVVHPGVVGDRGPSALDWACLDGEAHWGVTVLQAQAQMDAGPVWASEPFVMRVASKSSLYRQEVSAAALHAVLRAVAHFERSGGRPPIAPAADARGRWRPLMTQAERHIDWATDDTCTVLRKIHAADGTPGVLDHLFGEPCHLFDAHPESTAPHQPPGRVIARRDDAVLRSTVDGAVWIGHVRRSDGPSATRAIKLPTALAFAQQVAQLPEWSLPIDAPAAAWQRIRYEAHDGVGTLHFALYNGALSTALCGRLLAALRFALQQPEPVLVLLGGADFWCNGIHLNVIEAAESPADESWANINAIDDVTQALIEASGKYVIAALQGDAGAGGAFMALAADQLWARQSVVLNLHYKNMGNLYGSEYWTYLLPRRLGDAGARALMQQRLPISAAQALQLGVLDAVFGSSALQFCEEVQTRAAAVARSPALLQMLQDKRARREHDEAQQPLASYRQAELQQMQRCFYGFDTSYHVARSNFVRRVLPAWTPRHLAIHRHRAGR